MKKIGGFLAAGMLYASPLASAAEPQSLEGKVVAQNIPEISERYIYDSPSRRIANEVLRIKKMLKEAEEGKIDLSKEYDSGSPEEILRTFLVLETRSLAADTMSALRNGEYNGEFTESILSALNETAKAFWNHACRYPIVGRQKLIVNLLAGRAPELRNEKEPLYAKDIGSIADNVQFRTGGKGYSVPVTYKELLGKPIQTWEHWSINYTRLDEVSRNRSEFVPPEFREEHLRKTLK